MNQEAKNRQGYVCAGVRCFGGGARAGLWHVAGEPITRTREEISRLLRDAMNEGNPSHEESVERYIRELEVLFDRTWPGSPFFIETFQDVGCCGKELLMAVNRTGGLLADSLVRNEETAVSDVTAYLDTLVWDGTPRLDRWLVAYAGAADNPYTRGVSRAILVAAVRRARSPGCVFDQLPVLVGPQGSGKSRALRVLAVEDNWFIENGLRKEGHCWRVGDLPPLPRVTWIVEAQELNCIGRDGIESLKAFMTTTHDEVRPPCARKRERLARQFVLIGTASEIEWRAGPSPRLARFWPVPIQRFDLERLRAERDQLWAEASEVEARSKSIGLDSFADDCRS